MPQTGGALVTYVNCRIGSLEKYIEALSQHFKVNCRIGSLEIKNSLTAISPPVNCRIGSLEKV